MSIFDFSVLNLKKTIHFIHFGVRPADLCGVTFMLWGGDEGVVTWRPLCCGFIKCGKMCKKYEKGYKFEGCCLLKFLGGYFLGMFWILA